MVRIYGNLLQVLIRVGFDPIVWETKSLFYNHLDEIVRGIGADGRPDKSYNGLTSISLLPGVWTRLLMSDVIPLVWSLEIIVKADEVKSVRDFKNTSGLNYSFCFFFINYRSLSISSSSISPPEFINTLTKKSIGVMSVPFRFYSGSSWRSYTTLSRYWISDPPPPFLFSAADGNILSYPTACSSCES